MKKKKLGTIILAGTMLLSLAGCGVGTNKANSYSKYVTLGDYTGIEYTRVVEEVTDEQIQSRLDSFVNGLMETTEITDRAVEDGDIVNIDYVGTMDGEAFEGGTAEGYDLTIGSGSFINGFEEGLISHEIGEKVSLDLQFPDPYENNPDLAGKDVNFAVTINSISVKTTPELTDALVKDNTDYDTVAAYKESIQKELEQQAEDSADSKAETDIFNKVVENSKISGYDEAEVKDLVDKQFEQFKQTAKSYEQYGYTYEMILSSNGYNSEEELKDGITEYCKNFLDQKMVMYSIAKAEGIKVSNDEQEAKLKEYMENYGIENEQDVYDYFGEDYFEYSILSEKVIAFLKEKAVLVDSTEAATTEEEKAEEETTTEAAE